MVKSNEIRYIVHLDESISEIFILYILYSDLSVLVISDCKVFAGTVLFSSKKLDRINAME